MRSDTVKPKHDMMTLSGDFPTRNSPSTCLLIAVPGPGAVDDNDIGVMISYPPELSGVWKGFTGVFGGW